MTAPIVRTVLGDVAPASLGAVDYHEHLFQTTPLLAGDEIDDEAASRTEAATLVAAGIAATVEATPTGLGRDPAAVARISRATGLTVVHVTGAHHGGHYPAEAPLTGATEPALAARFTADVVEGFAEAPGIRAGVLKAGLRYWAIPPFERRVLGAVAAAHRSTGAPLMVHLEHGSAAHEVLDLLVAEGVPATAVALAHVDRLLDPGLHRSLAERGAFLGYDTAGRHHVAPDSAVLACLLAVAEDEAGARALLLGGDVARSTRYRAYGGMPGLDYVARRFLPRLREAGGDALTRRVTVENPARWLAFAPPRAA